MNGLESDALLWLAVNDKSSLPAYDDATLAKFDAGKEIEILARKMFDGVDLSEFDFMPNILETKKYLGQRKIIFEAGFMINNLYSRSDIIFPNDDGSWDLIEIKGSTKVKESHVKDLAFQKHVLELSGFRVRDCYVIHLSRDYVRGDFLDIGLLFQKSIVTKRVDEEIIGIDVRIAKMFEVINLPECPMFDYHDMLRSEYGNPLIDEFLASLPEHSVFELYRVQSKKAVELLDRGIVLIKDIPDDFPLTAIQKIQKECILNDKVHVLPHLIKKFTSSIIYPVYHLDFETMMPAIPLFKNSRSYNQIPFQYSLHIEHENGLVEHREFLYSGEGDPRLDFLKSLKNDLVGASTILVYNEGFEISRLNELARLFPEEKVWLQSAIGKVVDLITPFTSFAFYDAKQRGSCSLKKVMPIFHERSYNSLNIKEGGDASRSYYQNFGKLSPELKTDLLEYCKLDTEGMVSILRGLVDLANVKDVSLQEDKSN